MTEKPFLQAIEAKGVARVTLNRTKVHNAFDDELIVRLTTAFEALGKDDKIRVVVMAANGKSFSAGGDLNWMKRMAGYDFDENVEDALALAKLMRTIDRLPKPTVAIVQGAAYGGGVGLVACCDIAIAADHAAFSLSEVRLGLIPAAISPYVIAAMGTRAARRYFLTGERFDANEALRVGLVHQVVTNDALDSAESKIVDELLAGGPAAQRASKTLIRRVARRPIDDETIDYTARAIAEVRASPEGREGVSAFLEKRAPEWRGSR